MRIRGIAGRADLGSNGHTGKYVIQRCLFHQLLSALEHFTVTGNLCDLLPTEHCKTQARCQLKFVKFPLCFALTSAQASQLGKGNDIAEGRSCPVHLGGGNGVLVLGQVSSASIQCVQCGIEEHGFEARLLM